MIRSKNSPSSNFDQERFHSLLATPTFGRNLVWFPELESTNSHAKGLIRQSPPAGTVILTDHQTQGRGRGSRRWKSHPRAGLTFSIIIYPEIPVAWVGLLSIVAGAAVADCLAARGLSAGLKWPNDILLESRKTGGILCESRILRNSIAAVVIGIGLNVNETRRDFPRSIRSRTTSLREASGNLWDREMLLAGCLKELEHSCRLLLSNRRQDLLDSWIGHCAHLEQPVTFHHGSGLKTGIFLGLTEFGEAVLKVDGKRETIRSGGITFDS